MDKNPQIPESKEVKITITLPTNSYFMSGIRDFTLSLIRNLTEFSEQWAFRFQSVVDELCNNAIEHGSAPEDDIKIIFISHPHDSIEIMVEDTNQGKNKVTASQLQKIVDEHRAADEQQGEHEQHSRLIKETSKRGALAWDSDRVSNGA